MYLGLYQILKVSNLHLNHCGRDAIVKFFFGGGVTWPDLVTWLWWPGPKTFRKVAEQLSEQLCKNGGAALPYFRYHEKIFRGDVQTPPPHPSWPRANWTLFWVGQSTSDSTLPGLSFGLISPTNFTVFRGDKMNSVQCTVPVSHATCHMPCVTCHVSHATCHMPRVTCHVSHVTCHMSTCHMPLVTCQVSHVRCQCRTTLCSLHRLALSDVPNRMGQTTAKRTTRQRRWQSLRPQRLFARMGCADEQAMHSCVNCDGCMYGRCMRVCSSNMENAYDVTCEPFSPTLHLFSWKSDQKPIPLFSV